MKRQLSYEQIKNQFSLKDWNIDQIATCSLNPLDNDKSVKYIIDKLNSSETSTRYIASMLIIQFEINDAVEMLIKRTLDEDTLNSNGTMTFALEDLDCRNNLVQVFKILATQSYESKCHAYNILSEQEFEFSKQDISEMKQILEDVIKNKTANQIFDNETLEMVLDGYEGFKQYLND